MLIRTFSFSYCLFSYTHSYSLILLLTRLLSLTLSLTLTLTLTHTLSHSHTHPLSLVTANTEVPSKEDISSMGIGALKAFVSQWGCQAHKDDLAHIVGKLQHRRTQHACSDKLHTLLCLALPCLALPCLALPCLALPCLALPCLALPYLALPCLALPCLALPCLACVTMHRLLSLSVPYSVAIAASRIQEVSVLCFTCSLSVLQA